MATSTGNLTCSNSGSHTVDGNDVSVSPSETGEDFFRISAMIAILTGVIAMAAALQSWKRRWLWLQDTSVGVILGIALGAIISYGSSGVLSEQIVLSPMIFYNVILPPIILEGGMGIDRHLFKRNFPVVALLALPGLAVGIFVSGAILYGLLEPSSLSFVESLTFMSVLAATDPVSVLATFQAVPIGPDLNEAIFGESALNDATGIIMFRLFKSFSAPGTIIDGATVGRAIGMIVAVFILATIVGILFGAIISAFIKYIDFGERGAVSQASVVLSLACQFFARDVNPNQSLHLTFFRQTPRFSFRNTLPYPAIIRSPSPAFLFGIMSHQI